MHGDGKKLRPPMNDGDQRDDTKPLARRTYVYTGSTLLWHVFLGQPIHGEVLGSTRIVAGPFGRGGALGIGWRLWVLR